VILVGGFGRCRYLYHRLSTLLGNKSEVLQGDNFTPWTAICRGAVISALTAQGFLQEQDVQIVSRISRANYGLLSNKTYVEGYHDTRDRYYCKKECIYMAREQCDWFLRRVSNPISSVHLHREEKTN
jgi:hypothetical protein